MYNSNTDDRDSGLEAIGNPDVKKKQNSYYLNREY